MSHKKITRLRRGPAPRAGWAIDSVLTRNGNIDVRKLYIGPKDVDPEDMVNLMSAVAAASISTAFLDSEDRRAAKERFLDLVEARIETATEANPPEPSKREEPRSNEGDGQCQ